MKIHITNGCIYDIPKDVKYANASIAFSDRELQTCSVPIRCLEREVMFERNKELLKFYKYIGYEEIYKKDMHMQIEMHWFIDMRDLGKCIVSMEW